MKGWHPALDDRLKEHGDFTSSPFTAKTQNCTKAPANRQASIKDHSMVRTACGMRARILYYYAAAGRHRASIESMISTVTVTRRVRRSFQRLRGQRIL